MHCHNDVLLGKPSTILSYLHETDCMLFLSSFDNTDRIALALNVQYIHNANFEALWHYLRPYTAHTNVHVSIRQK